MSLKKYSLSTKDFVFPELTTLWIKNKVCSFFIRVFLIKFSICNELFLFDWRISNVIYGKLVNGRW